MRRSLLTSALALALVVVAACGDDSDGDASPFADDGGIGVDPDDLLDDLLDDPEGAIGDLGDRLEDLQAREGGGSATLVVGDRTWEFDSVLCAFGPDDIGDEDAEFVLSSIEDGLQLYATIDGFGHSVSLNDIEDFENPSVSLEAGSFFGDDDEFIEVDGNDVFAESRFFDGSDDDTVDFDGVEGTLTASCA